MTRLIFFWHNVRHYYCIGRRGSAQGKIHYRFSAHGWSEQNGLFNFMDGNKLRQGFCQQAVVELLRMWGSSVVALVYEIHGKAFAQHFANGLPVVRSAEQTVKNEERLPLPHGGEV